MSHAMEIVKFRAEPSREKEFLATRDEAISALSEAFPGLIRAQLSRIQGNLWVDMATWESMEDAKRAAAGCLNVPAFTPWYSCISDTVSMEHATVEDVVVV